MCTGDEHGVVVEADMKKKMLEIFLPVVLFCLVIAGWLLVASKGNRSCEQDFGQGDVALVHLDVVTIIRAECAPNGGLYLVRKEDGGTTWYYGDEFNTFVPKEEGDE
jgi:hypothetical protein